MHCVRNVTEDLIWIGGNDRQSPRFESCLLYTSDAADE